MIDSSCDDAATARGTNLQYNVSITHLDIRILIFKQE